MTTIHRETHNRVHIQERNEIVHDAHLHTESRSGNSASIFTHFLLVSTLRQYLDCTITSIATPISMTTPDDVMVTGIARLLSWASKQVVNEE